MVLSLRLEGSHSFSWNGELKFAFRATIVPERVKPVPLDLFIVLDVSGSMGIIDNPPEVDDSLIAGTAEVDGHVVRYLKDDIGVNNRLEVALEAIRNLLENADTSTRVTIITFSDNVNVLCRRVPPSTALEYLEEIVPDGNTALYSAVKKAISLIDEHPARVLLITDGYPTDVEDEKEYSKLEVPRFSQFIPIGVGEYNAKILRSLADLSNGRFYHVNDVSEISRIMEEERAKPSGGVKVRVDVFSKFPVNYVNYTPPIYIGTVEGVTRIYGFIQVPPKYSGELVRVKLTYTDTLDDREYSLEKFISVIPATDSAQFVSGLNKYLLWEAEYYEKMKEISKLLESGMQVEATRKMQELKDIAERTRKADLIEATKKLMNSSDEKEISSEITRKMRS
ncbi:MULTISPECIES: VWA domain-containing protein [Metallosphaera]|uniref:VWA domain-containing protein n=1 Tax=Metallosphaera TaxID=41980 RepID=UPI001F067FEA|nr:VWA domain-containing protein [Metallosphaera sedula]MCH1771095.1 VWA domain-containing protein [Metallosphaera sedula]MCP6729466.1 VWA domain-containing protein [Metallosphaera sedula]